MKLKAAVFSAVLIAMSSIGVKAATLGTATIDDSSKNSFVAIDLNQLGIDYLNAYGNGNFVLGGSYAGTGFVFGHTPASTASNGKNVELSVAGTTGNKKILSGNTGWFNADDHSDSAGNYAAGTSLINGRLRNFFVFEKILQDVGSVLTATLTIYNPVNGNNGTGTYSVHDYAKMGQGTTPFQNSGTQPGTYDALIGSVAAVPAPGAGIGLGSALLMSALWFSNRRRRLADT